MVATIGIICMTGIFLLMPLGFWMYISEACFVKVSRRDFGLGIFAGAIATLPIVFHEFPVIGRLVSDIFFEASIFSNFFFDGSLLLYFLRFLVIIWLVFAMLWGIIYGYSRLRALRDIRVFLGQVWVMVFSLWGFWLVYSLFGNVAPSETMRYGDVVFSSLAGICVYYGIIALLEEGVKLTASVSLWENYVFARYRGYLAFMLCIALGFSFFENLLYMSAYIDRVWIDGWLAQLVFLRSLFSVTIHVLCSVCVGIGFWYLMSDTRYSLLVSMSLFILCTLWGMLAHGVFDILMQFGLIAGVFLYIFAAYILIGSLSHSRDLLPGAPELW